MKTIIIEGGDRLGKNSLIESLSKHYNYDNVTIRHFGKPPSEFQEGETPLEFQAKCFIKEGALLNMIKQSENDQYNYFENVVIYNRFIYGEYVYGQMFRNQDPNEIESFLKGFEELFLLENPETYLILLTVDPDFFLSKEDGNSFSKNLEQKTKEVQLFDEIFEKSQIDNKLRIKVNEGNSFHAKDFVLTKVLEFIK